MVFFSITFDEATYVVFDFCIGLAQNYARRFFHTSLQCTKTLALARS